MELTKKALNAISGSSRIMNLIAAELDCSESTIRRWIHQNNEALTMAVPLKIIKKETGLSEKEILTESKRMTA